MAEGTRSAVWFTALNAVLLLASLTVTGCFNPDDDGAFVPEGTEGDGTTSDAGGSESGNAAGSSSGSTGGDDEVSTSGSTGVDTGDAQVCSDYCGLIGDHCQGDDAQYNGDAICEATCAHMPVGSAGDELGNSASCRTFHAVLAAEEPSTHCAHAGPAGDGTCGADCESFCSVALTLCGGDLSVFSGAEDCISTCETFPTEPEYSADVPDGDSFACRLRHLTLASLQPEVHCSHIGTDSPVCFD